MVKSIGNISFRENPFKDYKYRKEDKVIFANKRFSKLKIGIVKTQTVLSFSQRSFVLICGVNVGDELNNRNTAWLCDDNEVVFPYHKIIALLWGATDV